MAYRSAQKVLLLVLTSFAFLAFAAMVPQAPATAKDTLFARVERFEKNARSVTRVESDGKHHRYDHDSDTGGARVRHWEKPDSQVADQQAPAEANPRTLSTVYVFGYDKPGLYNPADVQVFRQKIHAADWTCRTCEGRLPPGRSIDSCSRPAGANAVESAVIVVKPMSLTFVHTIGKHSDEPHESLSCNE